MHECLKKVPNYTRILGDEEGFIPILPEEERLLKKLIARTEREKQKGKIDWQISNSNGKKSDAEPTDDLIGMSYGVIENDEVVVADGPLKGFEGRIVKIDRHKREVYLDIPFLGELRRIRLGLEIVEKK